MCEGYVDAVKCAAGPSLFGSVEDTPHTLTVRWLLRELFTRSRSDGHRLTGISAFGPLVA
jgi:hypothetical protein